MTSYISTAAIHLREQSITQLFNCLHELQDFPRVPLTLTLNPFKEAQEATGMPRTTSHDSAPTCSTPTSSYRWCSGMGTFSASNVPRWTSAQPNPTPAGFDLPPFHLPRNLLREIYYLWRSQVSNPGSAHVIKPAVAASADTIITYNKRDFPGASSFGIDLMISPGMLKRISTLWHPFPFSLPFQAFLYGFAQLAPARFTQRPHPTDGRARHHLDEPVRHTRRGGENSPGRVWPRPETVPPGACCPRLQRPPRGAPALSDAPRQRASPAP